MSERRVVILGNGVAGATAALELRARDERVHITMVSDESDYFFSRTALMYALMDKLSRKGLEPFERHVWDRQRIERVRGRAVGLDHDKRTLTLDAGPALAYDELVIATGARARSLDIPGIQAVQSGLTSFVTLPDLDACESLIASSRSAVVVGGGLIGVELVECLVHHRVKTTFVVREPWCWPAGLGREEGEIVANHLRKHGVDLRVSATLASVESEGNGRVSSVKLSSGESVACEMLGACIGVEPNVQWLRERVPSLKIERGIVVDDRLRTSLANVWAAGDCAEVHTSEGALYEPIWYTAKRHGAFVARQLSGSSEAYRAPVFKNSAKFFELEYTAVGRCDPSRDKSAVSLHPARPVAFRVFEREGVFTGFSALGSRWDTTLLGRWIEEARTVEWARTRLREAQFDPEFSRANLSAMTAGAR